jgi:hypothetical protein
MRDLADSESDETSRNALLELAKGYDKLCSKFLQMGQDAANQKL